MTLPPNLNITWGCLSAVPSIKVRNNFLFFPCAYIKIYATPDLFTVTEQSSSKQPSFSFLLFQTRFLASGCGAFLLFV